MRVHEIADSLSGQEVSPKSTFSKRTLDELLSSCSPDNSGFCGSRLYSLGHILLTGNMSADRLVEVLHSKRDNHVELTFFHDNKHIKGSSVNYLSRFDLLTLKRSSLDHQYELFLDRVIDRFKKAVAIAIYYGELKEEEFLSRVTQISFKENKVENYSLLQNVKSCASSASINLVARDEEGANDQFKELLVHVNKLKQNVGASA